MRKDHDEIPKINLDSVLDPPQIKLTSEEIHRGSIEGDAPVPIPEASVKHSRFKLPKFLNRFNFKKRDSSEPSVGTKRWKPGKRFILATVAVVSVILILIVIPGVLLAKDGLALKNSATALKDSGQSKNIAVVKSQLAVFKADFEKFKGSYSGFRWAGRLPFIGVYWRDGDAALKAGTEGLAAADIVIETAEPYADIIGFGGPDAQGGDTANDRIEFIIQTVDDILPRIDELSAKAQAANAQLSKIDPERYPEEFRGIKVREQLTSLLANAEEATRFISQSKPLLEAAPYLLGTEETRRYLLLFQNDKELRPTGGFMTAYSIIEVSNGKIQPVSSSDIYRLDAEYNPTIDAPEPIVKYLKGPYLITEKFRLRDMNWSPDFKVAMDMFMPEAQDEGIEDVDGVIAVDTQVVVNLLNAIGPIDVPGYGQFSTNNDERCACPQVIYELESFADVEGPIVWSENEPGKIVFAPENYLNRKEIVGPLMNSVLANALGQPQEKMSDLFQAGWRSMTEKHVLLYMFDEKAQAGAEAFGIAGRVSEPLTDYIQIVDANLGGRKSNLYVTQEVVQDVEVAGDGTITKTVSITYQNPQDFDGWLNSVLPNWTRIYVPKGSEVVSTEGFEDEGEVYEELGKTVISGGFELRPKGIKKLVVKYKLPFKADKEYKMLIQKQAGTDAPLHTINVGRNTEEFFLRTDKEIKFKI